MGGWAVAQSPILGTTIRVSLLKHRGYVSMIDYYSKNTKLRFGEPPYTRPVQPALSSVEWVRWCERHTGRDKTLSAVYSIMSRISLVSL